MNAPDNARPLPEIKVGHRYPLPGGYGPGGSVHVFDENSHLAVNAAWEAGRPLLVRGDPGTGKTQLGRAVAAAIGWHFLAEVITGHTEIENLWYHFDAVSRLGMAQIMNACYPPGALKPGTVPLELAPTKFLSPGILWWAYDWQTARDQYQACTQAHFYPHGENEGEPPQKVPGVVLLLDEIDKASGELPNSLLETLDAGRFRIPWVRQTVGGGARPLVIITTNEDRKLPPAFVRRCLVLNLSLPETEEQFVDFMVRRGAQHFQDGAGKPLLKPDIMKEAAHMLFSDRRRAEELVVMRPGQAEYLDLLRVLAGRPVDQHEHLLKKVQTFIFHKQPGMGSDSEGNKQIKEAR
jgi:MoxR-like ATPase